MFTRRRSNTKMGDVAQFRKEVEEFVDKSTKEFEKSCENYKSDEKVRLLIVKVQNASLKIKQDVKKCEIRAEFDAEQARKDFDQMMGKIGKDIKKDVEALDRNAAEVVTKVAHFFDEISCTVAKKMENFHLKDEVVKIRIEIERKLSDMTSALEKEYDNDNSNVKDMIKQLKKTNESIGKEIGKRLEEFRNDRIDVQNNVRQMLKKISHDFEKNVKNDSEVAQDVIAHVKKSTNEIAIDIGERFDKMKKSINNLKIFDEMHNIRKEAEKTLTSMSNDFKKKVRQFENGDVYFIDEITKNFSNISEKVRQDVHNTLDDFHQDGETAKKKVEELFRKISTDFERQVERLKEKGPIKDILNTVEEVSKQASTDISNILDGLKKKLAEFENDEKVTKARKEVEGTFANMKKEFETDYKNMADNHYVKEAIAKFKEIHDRVDDQINDVLNATRNEKTKVDSEIHKILALMNSDFEHALDQIKENPVVKDIIGKVREVTGTVSNNITQIWQIVGQDSKIIIDSAKGQAENLRSNVANMSDEAKKSVSNAYEDLQEKVNNVADGIKMELGLGKGQWDKQKNTISHTVKEVDYENMTCIEKIRKITKDLYYAGVYFFIFLIQSIPAALRDCVRVLKPKSMENTVVLITGTGNGLGKALAKKFVRLGAKVACVDINESANEETGEELRKKVKCQTCVRTFSADISKPENCKKLAAEVLEQFGKVDILINNAGILACHKITDGDDKSIQRVIDVNLMSNFWMVRAFLPHMIERKLGQIVFINSQSGIQGLAMASSYAASKAGLLGLAYSLESELRRDPCLNKIKVTSVHPLYFSSTEAMDKTVKSKILSVNEVADWTIHGIRRNLFTFTVPMVYGGFLLSVLFRLLPLRTYEHFLKKIGGIKSSAAAHFKDPSDKKCV